MPVEIRACADFRNTFAAFQQQRIGHESHNVRLGNRLALNNRQRRQIPSTMVARIPHAALLRIAASTNSERTPLAAI